MKSFEETMAEVKKYLGPQYETFEAIMRELARLRNTTGGRVAVTRTSHSPELAQSAPHGHKLASRYKLTDSSIVNDAKEHLKKSTVVIVFLDEQAKEFILYRSMTFQEFEKGGL